MKTILKSLVTVLALCAFSCSVIVANTGCASAPVTAKAAPAAATGSTFGPTLVAALQIAQTAESAYAQKHPGGNDALVSAGLSGLAALAQAYVGQTPAQVNDGKGLATGAGVPAVGPAVQSLLPANTPITQAQVNNLFQAAAIASAP